MSEKPKSIWKKSWAGGRGLFFGWLILMAPLVVIFLIWTVAERTPINKSGDELKLFVVAGIGMTIIFLLATFIRWLFCWRNFKRSLFCLACFATLIALFYAEEDWRGWHDWNQFKHQWEAKGEKFDWQSIVPPPVPDDQNFAMQPIWVDSIKFEYGTNVAKQWYGKTMTESERTNLVDRLGISIYGNMYGGEYEAKSPHSGHWAEGTETDLKNWQQYYRDLASKTNEFPIAPQPQSPAQDVLLALSKYDSTIEELRQAGQLPYSRFPLEYDKDNPSAIMLPHLAMLKRSSQVLQLRAIAELQNGESEKALDDVKLMLRLTDAI
ncbi:MAG TPA: hypothetical protein VMV89_03595, partial [Candidatus Paceibacterota bacterium]|nr:hypothetical protein [Candidatus Paceibacterota bacterium]